MSDRWFDIEHDVPYHVFQNLLFGRSLAVLLVLLFLEIGVRRHPFILPLLYRSLKVSSRSMRVLDVQVSGHIPGNVQKILSCFIWMVRAALTVVVCFIWDREIAPNRNYDIRRTTHWNRISFNCATGWRCYALRQPDSSTDKTIAPRNMDEFIRVSVIWDLEEICQFFGSTDMSGPVDLPDRYSRSSRDAGVTCWRFFNADFGDLVVTLGSAAAIFALLLLVFEGCVALLVRHSRRRFNCGHAFVILTILSFMMWITLLVWEAMTSISCWVSRLTFLAVPVLLINSRRLSSLLKLEMQLTNDLRYEQLQESDIGLQLDKLVGS